MSRILLNYKSSGRTEIYFTEGLVFVMETERLVLRKWTEADAGSLFEYAKDPDVGPVAGWPPHKSVDESLDVIRNVLNGAECYAICEKGSEKVIGAIELRLNGHTDMTERDDLSIITQAKMYRCR